MSGRIPPDIKRGRMTFAEESKLLTYAERGLKAGQIALRLNRHPATVNYAMIRLGVREPVMRAFEYMRAGHLVKSFSSAEDAYVLELRMQGLSTPRIAQLVTERFGHPRTAATINTRLTMLSNVEAAA